MYYSFKLNKYAKAKYEVNRIYSFLIAVGVSCQSLQ